MRKIFFLVCAILLIAFESKSQDWIRIYGNNMIADVTWVIETYDKGYLLLDNSHDYLWLVKTDVNGYKLWEKWIGTGTDAIRFGNIEETPDHGYILGGAFEKYNKNSYDPAIIKLNSCGELDWCSVINTVGIYDFGMRAKPTPEGDFVLVAQGSVFIPGENVQLFKFDNSGNLLWKNTYDPDSLIWSPEVHDVRVDDDGYLISAKCCLLYTSDAADE